MAGQIPNPSSETNNKRIITILLSLLLVILLIASLLVWFSKTNRSNTPDTQSAPSVDSSASASQTPTASEEQKDEMNDPARPPAEARPNVPNQEAGTSLLDLEARTGRTQCLSDSESDGIRALNLACPRGSQGSLEVYYRLDGSYQHFVGQLVSEGTKPVKIKIIPEGARQQRGGQAKIYDLAGASEPFDINIEGAHGLKLVIIPAQGSWDGSSVLLQAPLLK